MTSISIKTEGIDAAKLLHGDKIVEKALIRTINEMGAPMLSGIIKNIADNNSISKARIKEAISITQRASSGNPSLIITTSGRVPGIQTYAVQADTRGHNVTVQIKRQGERKGLGQNAFYRRPQHGGSGVFSRYDRAGNLLGTTSSGKAKLRRLYGPSVPGLANTDGWDAVQSVIDERFLDRFDHNLEHLLLSK